VHFLRIINIPKRGIGAATIKKILDKAHATGLSCMDIAAGADTYFEKQPFIKKLKDFADQIAAFREIAEDGDVHEVIREIYEKTGYLEMLQTEFADDAQTRMENVEEFINSAYEFESNGGEKLVDFLQNIALITDLDSMDEAGGVTLMTIHAAKGLEFETIFVAGMEETLFPSRMAVAEDNVEEERRLCYVAITRAKRNLYLTNSRVRSYYGEYTMNPPSRFIEEIDDNLLDYLNKPEPSSRPAEKKKGYSGFNPAWVNPNEKKPMQVSDDFKVGAVVQHDVFGRGPILSITGEGNQKVATVDFDIAGQKKMFLSFAPLKIVG